MANYNDEASMLDALTRLERRMLAVETTARVNSASVGTGGITVHDGGSIDVLSGGSVNIEDGGSINVEGGGNLLIRDNGTLDVNGSATFNNTARFDGDTTFSNSLTITSGNFSFPNGSIQGAALASQLDVGFGTSSRSPFGLTSTSWTTIDDVSLTKPSWATSASVYAFGYVGLYTIDNAYGITNFRVGINTSYATTIPMSDTSEWSGARRMEAMGSHGIFFSTAPNTITARTQCHMVADSALNTSAHPSSNTSRSEVRIMVIWMR